MNISVRPTRIPKRIFAVFLLAAAVLLLGIGLWTLVFSPGPGVLASFSESGVRVVIEFERRADGQALLKATFTPLEAGFHLYSKDLPPGGVAGVGRPTRLELLPDGRLQPAGTLHESLPAAAGQTPPGSLPIPVYPPGPVTLTLPVRLPGGSEPGLTSQLSVTYMACSSEGICLRPVIARIIPVKIPTQ